MSPSIFLTSPPMLSMRDSSPGKLALWSRVISLALYLPDSLRHTMARESPTCATHSRFFSVSITAKVQVAPLNAQSKSPLLSACSSTLSWISLKESLSILIILTSFSDYIFSKTIIGSYRAI